MMSYYYHVYVVGTVDGRTAVTSFLDDLPYRITVKNYSEAIARLKESAVEVIASKGKTLIDPVVVSYQEVADE